jgi:hypothetical protein
MLSIFEVTVWKVYLREGGNGGGGIAYEAELMYHTFDVGTSPTIELGAAGIHLITKHI